MVRAELESPAAGSRSRPAGTTCSRDSNHRALLGRLLFDVHQDTVPTDGMTIAPFGHGSTTGGCRAGAPATSREGWRPCSWRSRGFAASGRPGSASVVLACTVDEEFTHTGSSRLARTDHGADLAIVAEPTLLDLVHCHKGALRWKIRTRGVACHSSTPDLGVNAIYRMGRVLDALPSTPAFLVQQCPTRSSARPAFRSAGSRGGKASTSFPTGARSRSIAA